MPSIWIQVRDTNGENVGTVVKIKSELDDVNDLCKAIKVELEPDLNHCSAARLSVYPAGTAFGNYNAITAFKRSVSPPVGTSEEAPLVVIAPADPRGVPQSIDFRARFVALLVKGNIRPKPHLLSRLQKVRNSAIITAGTVSEAIQWYEWIKDLPASVTRGIFQNATGYELDGMHPQFDGILLAGDDEGRLYMFKLTPSESDKEVLFATRVSGKPFLVASSYERAAQEDANGDMHACGGLLMRKFDRSLFGHDFQCSAAVLLRRCKAMITAINAMHTDRIVHMDLKEANIFVRDGLWFVGDFGSCVYCGDTIESTTEGCYPAALNMIIGKPARWHHDWFALALVFASQLRVHGELIDVPVEGLRDRVLASISANCEVEELEKMLTVMVDCDEQYMHFEGQAVFAAVTDEVKY